jgi:hypothetical protein
VNYLFVLRTTIILFTFLSISVQYGLADAYPLADAESFTKNKTIPSEMQEVIVAALACYPELADTRIEFIYKEDIRKSVMQAQPKVSSLFRGKAKRVYVIKISRYLKLNYDNLDISTLPFEVLVGWIAHELGHIMDYKDRSGLAMIGFGAKYWLSENFLKKAERRADMYALRHGLGDKIMKTKNYVLNHEGIPDWYKQRMKALYMSPQEFSELLSEAAE